MSTRTVSVDLIARVTSYMANLKTAAMATREFTGELDVMRKKNAQGFNDVTSSMAKVGGALALLSGWAIKTAIDFDKAMSEVQAITGATADEMDKLREAALKAGQTTVFSATEAAGAEADLAKAGLTTSQILGGALSGALSLAAAGTIDLGQAATIAANTMNQFSLQGKDVGHIADLLAGAANATTADVSDLALALQMGGGAAHAAGLSLEDTLTALGALSKAALNGSDAGTSLKTMFLQLEGPSIKSADIMTKYGFSVYDAAGNMVGLYEIANRLQKSFGGLTQQQRNAAFATIFGNDAVRAANALYGQGAAGLHDINTQLLAQADAAGVAATKTDNLAGDLNKLKGKLDALMISSSGGATGGLRFLVQALDHLVGTFERLPNSVQSGIVILAGVSGAAILAAAAFLKARQATLGAIEAMATAGKVSEATAGKLSNVASFAGKAATAVALLEVASAALSAAFGTTIAPNIDALSNSLMDFSQTGTVTGTAVQVLGADMGHLDFALSTLGSGGMRKAEVGAGKLAESFTPLGAIADDTVQHATERISALDQALTQMVQSGHGDEAGKIFQAVWTEAQRMGISLEDLQNGFAGYTAAVAEASSSTDSQAAAAARAIQSSNSLAKAFGFATDGVKQLTAAMVALNGGELSWRQAERQAEAAVDALQAALKASNGSLDVHTEKGRAAAAAVDQLAQAAAAAMQAKIDETGSVDEGTKAYKAYIAQLRQTLLHAGMAKSAVDKLIASITNTPAKVTTTFNIKVHVSNPQDWSDLRRMEREGDKTLNRTVNVQPSHQQFRWGGITHASVGALRDASVYSPTSPARYAFAEPETGGEAFIPRHGHADRSVAILRQAAGWYGADVVGRPFRQASPSFDTRALATAVAGGGRYAGPTGSDLARAVQAGLQGVVVVMDGRAVGRVQALQADALGRGF